MEVLLSAEEDAEVRRITVTNDGPAPRRSTSRPMPNSSLAPQAADVAHPAFAKLFVETEYLAERGALLATRRRRIATEPRSGPRTCWRRWRDGRHAVRDRPRAASSAAGARCATRPPWTDGALSGTVGTVLDPVFSLRRRDERGPGRHGAGRVLDDGRALAGCDARPRRPASGRLGLRPGAMIAWTQAQVQLHHLGIDPGRGPPVPTPRRITCCSPAPRCARLGERSERQRGANRACGPQGISGDLPILLLRIDDVSDMGVARQVLLAHTIICAEAVRRSTSLSSTSTRLRMRRSFRARWKSAAAQPSRIRAESRRVQFTAARRPRAGRDLRAARVAWPAWCSRATADRLSEQLDARREAAPRRTSPAPSRPASRPTLAAPAPNPPLEYFNGLGGFADGRPGICDRASGLARQRRRPGSTSLPMPTSAFRSRPRAVVAPGPAIARKTSSPRGRTTRSAIAPSEAFYFYDDDDRRAVVPDRGARARSEGDFCRPPWPRLQPLRTRRTRHRAATCCNSSRPDDPIKVSRLRCATRSRTRAVDHGDGAYVEWVLGASRAAIRRLCADRDGRRDRCDVCPQSVEPRFRRGQRRLHGPAARQTSTWTGDRPEFLGRNGSLASGRAASPRSCRARSVPASTLAARCRPRSTCRRAPRWN